jgi:hypothetical protein
MISRLDPRVDLEMNTSRPSDRCSRITIQDILFDLVNMDIVILMLGLKSSKPSLSVPIDPSPEISESKIGLAYITYPNSTSLSCPCSTMLQFEGRTYPRPKPY